MQYELPFESANSFAMRITKEECAYLKTHDPYLLFKLRWKRDTIKRALVLMRYDVMPSEPISVPRRRKTV